MRHPARRLGLRAAMPRALRPLPIALPVALPIALLGACLTAACTSGRIPPLVPGGAPGLATTKPAEPAKSTPVPTREIDMAGECRRTEEDGYREEATVKVDHNSVKSLDWKLWVARRGSCEFHLPDFRQTRQAPHIELAATDGSACKVMIWQDPRRITVASANCEKRCTGGVYNKAWPVLFDPSSGDCAKVR